MKSSKPARPRHTRAVVAATPAPPRRRLWPYALGAVLVLLAVFQVYWPSITGPFLLDDTYLPYMLPQFEAAPLATWIGSQRPLLMLSYWLNFQHAGNSDTFAYHVVNVLLHFFNGALVLLAVWKVISWAGTGQWPGGILAVFAAGLFLLHPLQTESVSYIASRSETLSVFFVLAAFVVFLYRRGGVVSFRRTLAILALFACAVASKEHTAVFPVLLLITDYWWNPGFSLLGVRRNWKLYAPITIASVAGLIFVGRVLSAATTAGFRIKGLPWYDYFFTECRVVWEYVWIFLLPISQNVDPDVPISRGIADHGAIFGLLALAAVSIAAWFYRRRYPLAAYGWFAFLILIAPTSSFVPLQDPMAERRLYLPFIGLLFIVVEFARRWKASPTAMIAVLGMVLAVEGAFAHQRNQLWASAAGLWSDSVSKSPSKIRPRFQLAMAYFQTERYNEAIEEFQKTSRLGPPTFELLLDWALSLNGAGRTDEAIEKLREAVVYEKSAHAYSQIGMVYGKMGKYPQALDALATAAQLDPSFAMTYYYRGLTYSAQGNNAQAAEDFRHVLALDPRNQPARDALTRIGQ